MSQPNRFRRFLQTSLATAALAIGGVLFDVSLPRPGYSAEEIRSVCSG